MAVSYDVEIQPVDPNHALLEYTNVDRISYVNQESYGPGTKIGITEEARDGDVILVINVNAILTAKVEVVDE